MTVPRREALVLDADGERFRFYYDSALPELLHITLKHATTPGDAIQTFFEGVGRWDQAHLRFESINASHVLYWTRHTQDKSVVVISCFRRGESYG